MSIPLTSEPERLRTEIRGLFAKLAIGDLPERKFERAFVEKTVELYRAVVQTRLKKGEEIVREHHVVRQHLKLARSILRDADQLATSLYATDRRLIRLRSVITADRAVTCDERDETVFDDIPFDRIKALAPRREIRGSEALAGAVILGLSYLFKEWLAITGPILMGVGVLGILHAVLLPTRWIEVVTTDLPEPGAEPFLVMGLRRKNAKALVAYLRSRLAPTL